VKTKATSIYLPLVIYRALVREQGKRIPKTSISYLVAEAIAEKYGLMPGRSA
jgi:hypothetical protein